MKNENASGKNKNSHKTAILITAISVVAAIILTIVGCFAYILSSDKIYNGVYVGTLSLGGMTKEEAAEALEAKYDNNNFNFRLKYEDISFEIYSSRINLRHDFNSSAELAHNYGRDGSVFENIKNILSLKGTSREIAPVLTCDIDLLQHEISQYLSDNIVDVVEYSVEFGEDCLIVTNGRPGRGVDPERLMSKISKLYAQGDNSGEINIEVVDLYPEPIDVDGFVKEYSRAAADAICKEEGDSITIVPHVVGVKIDKDEAKTIIKQNRDNEGSYVIPAIITYPEITTEALEAEFADTIIGTYSTDYSTSGTNRKENIRIASEKINGLILNPGEIFSFNNVVGPRTEATGFKVAHVYSGSKVVDGIGGGICQVSSTLYNAVVFADLEIVYRTNHSLPVSYVPLGRDATVSYGTIDFKIKNNKEAPVKFEVIADGNRLTVNVYGRKKYQKDISIETNVVGYTQYSVTEIKDDTLYEGERKTEEKGSNGTRTEAYKIVKENGEVISRTLLNKSSYSPTSEVVRVGTKKKEEIPETPAPESAPVQPDNSSQSQETAAPPQTEEQIPQEIEPPVSEPQIPETPLAEQTGDGL